MEELKRQKQIINLGKLMVKELGLEDGVDTLSRWMAHYLAEKIILVESLPVGKQKEDAQKECFDIILKLWENRWKLPAGKRPLESFEPILKVLEKINPEKEGPFFYTNANSISEIDKTIDSEEINKYLETILKIDKVARIWINFLLQQAASKARDERTEAILNNTFPTADNDDIETIYLLLNDMEDYPKKDGSETLKKRIEELQKFTELNEFILGEYRKNLLNTDE